MGKQQADSVEFVFPICIWQDRIKTFIKIINKNIWQNY